ncbi:MAG: hypothetical protein ACTSUT_13675 [Promethearchaeota archaeon]
MDEIKLEDPLLELLHSLLDKEEEKKILSMIFKNYQKEKIIENLLEIKKSDN